MFFIYRPGRSLFWSLLWGTYGGALAWKEFFHSPWPDHHPLWFPVILGGVTFCVSAFVAATSLVWIGHRFTTFFTAAWRRF